MAGALSIAGDVIGIGSSVSSILGGGGGGAPSPQQAQQLADPFASSRGYYGQQMNNLMANPQSVASLPGYQFNFQQGLDAMSRSGAATGQAGGGAQMTAAEKWGQDYASRQFGDYYNMLAQLSGASWNSGPNAANAGLSAGQQAANAQNQGYKGLMQGMATLGGNLGTSGGVLPATMGYGDYSLSTSFSPSGPGGAPMTSGVDFLGGNLGGGMSSLMSFK